MADVSLGRLFIRFGIEDKDLKQGRQRTEKELRAMEKRVQQFQQKANQTIGRVAPWLSLAGAITGVARALQTMGQDARALEDLRTQSGLSVQSLFELRQMVNQTGGSMQDLTTAVGAFNTAILTASRDSRSEAAQAFRILGINIRDANGELITLDQVTDTLADRFSGWADGTNKAALATTVFGGAATAMTRALNEGKEGIRRAQEEIQKYGRTVAEIHVAQLEWVRQTDQLSTAMTNFRDRALTPMLPTLVRVINYLGEVAAVAADVEGAVKKAAREIAAQNYEKVAAKVKELAEEERKLTSTLEILTQAGDANTQAWSAVKAELDRVQAAAAKAKDEMRQLNDAMRDNASKSFYGDNNAPAESKPKPGRTRAGLSPDQQRALKGMLDQVSLLNQQLNGLPTKIGLIGEINTNTYDAMQAKVTETIDIINAKYKEQEDTVRNLHQLKMQLAREEQDTAMQTADMVGSAVSAMFSKSKAAAIAETIIHTATAVMRALRDVPWPYNLVQAAAIAATGAAQLAKIRSTTEKGGGGGSAGGVAASAPQSAPQQHALHVQGVDRASLYTGAVVENIIEAINEKVQQGVTLISTKNVPA